MADSVVLRAMTASEQLPGYGCMCMHTADDGSAELAIILSLDQICT